MVSTLFGKGCSIVCSGGRWSIFVGASLSHVQGLFSGGGRSGGFLSQSAILAGMGVLLGL